MKHEYTLFKRYKDTKNHKGVTWFFYYYDQNGNRIARSTGKSLKCEGEEIAKAFIKESTATTMTLSEYTQTFYKWGECLWIKRQIAKGKQFSKAMAHLRRSHLDTYILPKFGDRLVSSLNQVEIENWLVDLHSSTTNKALSNQTKNHILYTFRIILREAQRESLIEYNCLANIESLAVQAKSRDTFTRKELKKLFPSDEEALINIWKGEEYAYFFFILATTGMRRGEARALQWKHLIKGRGHEGVVIEQAIKNDDSLGDTKTGKPRVVILNKRGEELLKKWEEESPFTKLEDFIFFGSNSKRPIMGKTLQNHFKKALENAKINTKGRNLVIHSFRHTYNTLLRPVLPIDILQETTGHSSDSMTNHYTHSTILDSFNHIATHQEAFDNLF